MLFPVIVKKLKTMEVSILIIRQERPEDYDTVYHVVKEAFENAEYTDGNEQNLVAALRKSKSFIPELSLVAVEDEKIVGHILFTKVSAQPAPSGFESDSVVCSSTNRNNGRMAWDVKDEIIGRRNCQNIGTAA